MTSSKEGNYLGLYHVILDNFFIYFLNILDQFRARAAKGTSLYKAFIFGEKVEYSFRGQK